MPDIGVPELLIIAFIVVVLFGSKKLPGAARSIGQSLKIFKDETKGLRGDDADKTTNAPPTSALPPGPSTPSAATPPASSEPAVTPDAPPVTTPHV